jgi:hypothetical protein
VLCLIVVPLPPGKNPFAVQINNNNNNNNNNKLVNVCLIYFPFEFENHMGIDDTGGINTDCGLTFRLITKSEEKLHGLKRLKLKS